jgi:3-dehydroquinate synthase
MSHTLTVRLPGREDRSYNIGIARGALRALPARLRPLAPSGQVFLITDSTVLRLYGRTLAAGLHEVMDRVVVLDVAPGERSKRISVASALWSTLLREGIRRDCLVVLLGGGVIGDLGGFVAATVLRGVRFVQVPTTLLAQVDSSVGGKVGIDHAVGKNLVGVFQQPAAVFIDPDVLRTLPAVEFRNGLAEMAKIAVGLDAGYFRSLERAAPRIRREMPERLVPLIARAVKLKALVVERDERESGLRAVLNLGHTLGHALEAASGFQMSHGTAVAAGLGAEAELAVRLGIMKRPDQQRLLRLLGTLRLPTVFPPVPRASLFWRALGTDKKASARGVRFSLPAGIGMSAIGVSVPQALVADVTGVAP